MIGYVVFVVAKLPKCLLAAHNDLFPHLSEMHRARELLHGYGTVQEVLRVGEITVVGPITDDYVVFLIWKMKPLEQVVFRFQCQREADLEHSVFQQYSNPVKNIIRRILEIEDAKAVLIQTVFIHISVAVLSDGPLAGHVSVLCTIEPRTVIIVYLAAAEKRLLQDLDCRAEVMAYGTAVRFRN